MADSIDTRHLPAGFDAYAGYVNGTWPTWSELGLAPGVRGAYLLSIDVNGSRPDAMCLDVEKGDAAAGDVPGWLQQNRWRAPVIYTSVANAMAVITAAGNRPFLLWTAHYTNAPHLCGPSCGFGLNRTADATQWIDHGNYDESLVDPSFFPRLKGMAAAQPVLTKVPPSKEKPVFIVDAVDTKTQFLVFDNGKVAELHSTTIGSGLTAPAGPAGVGLPYISGAQADVDNIARGYAPV